MEMLDESLTEIVQVSDVCRFALRSVSNLTSPDEENNVVDASHSVSSKCS
jgi:hypothetical protein